MISGCSTIVPDVNVNGEVLDHLPGGPRTACSLPQCRGMRAFELDWECTGCKLCKLKRGRSERESVKLTFMPLFVASQQLVAMLRAICRASSTFTSHAGLQCENSKWSRDALLDPA